MQRLKKILLLVIGCLLVFGVALLGVLWFSIRASLPPLSGTIDVEGLTNAVILERDAAGIPTIRASDRGDLAFGTGFAHGQDRFFQMDLIRRQAAGELSALLGGATLNADKAVRIHRFRTRALAVIENLSEEDLAIAKRYVAGVNTGLESLGARPFEYLLLRTKPEPWKIEDSILVAYAMFLQLNDSRAGGDLRRGHIRRHLPEEVYEWIYQQHTPWDAPLIGGPSSALPIPSAEVISLRGVADREQSSDESRPEPVRGSNNWAVSGALTESGRALVSNDMHLGLSVPNIFYRARLVQTGPEARDLSGVTLPGVPFLIAGSNTHIAWGNTNAYGDFTDAVVIQPGAEADTYATPSGDRELEIHTESIAVKGREPVSFEVRETIWGPILEDLEYPEGEIAVSWTAHKPEAMNFNLLKLETVTTTEEALSMAATLGGPPQNLVLGDAEGNIGWTVIGSIPARTGYDPRLPADWSEGAGWQGWVAPEDYPRVYNPESGRIWTANSRVVDGDALAIIGDGDYALGARATQIRDQLFAQDQFTPADMLAIQLDDRALFLEPWQKLLLEELNKADLAEDDSLLEYRSLVQNWIPRATPDSVGYRLVSNFRNLVERRIYYALTTPVREASDKPLRTRPNRQFEAALWSTVTQQPSHLLPGDYSDWNAFFMSVVQESIQNLETGYKGSLSERRYGEVNTAMIKHPVSFALPFLSGWLDMPADELPGAGNVPRAQGRTFGAAERFTVAPGEEAQGYLHMPAGQSGHPLSDYYRLGHQDWVGGRESPFQPGEPVNTLTLIIRP